VSSPDTAVATGERQISNLEITEAGPFPAERAFPSGRWRPREGSTNMSASIFSQRRGLVRASIWVGIIGMATTAVADTLVTVRDDYSSAVSGAQVFRNCAYVGNTDGAGQVNVPGALAGDHLIARKLVTTGSTSKPAHGGWAYHVWWTNIIQLDNGSQVDHTIVDPSIVQNLVVRRDSTQIGFNLLASVEYNATSTNFAQIASGIVNASAYLFDVSDGQMFIEQATLFDDKVNFANADLQYFAVQWPNATIGGEYGVTHPGYGIHLPGPKFYTPWDQPTAFRTIIHEFGHYAFGAYDEYFKNVGPGTASSHCTLDRASHPEAERASIMDYQYDATEICHDDSHNADTAQGQINGKSVWGTLVGEWTLGDWQFRTPMSRGTVDPGPNMLSCIDALTPTLIKSSVVPCPPISVHATYMGSPVANAGVLLQHGGDTINEGETNMWGNLTVYGGVAGDTISIAKQLESGPSYYSWLSANVPVGTCGPVNVELQRFGFIIFYLLPDLSFPGPDFTFQMPFIGDPLREIVSIDVVAVQNGFQVQQVQTYYDRQQNALLGNFQFDLNLEPSFDLQIRSTNVQGMVSQSAFRYVGAQYHRNGPGSGPGGQIDSSPFPPIGWDLFPPENMVGVTVDSGSLFDGTSVLVGATPAPARTPQELVFVAGPYSVNGDQQPTGVFGLSIPFQANRYCGIDQASLGIYVYTGNGWQPLPTDVDWVHSVAYATARRWGIYGVLARPSPIPPEQCGAD